MSKELSELRALVEKATQGPWHHVPHRSDRGELLRDSIVTQNDSEVCDDIFEPEDAALIVAAINALPDLIARAEHAERLEDALREIERRTPVTCEMTLAHEMGEIARAALEKNNGG